MNKLFDAAMETLSQFLKSSNNESLVNEKKQYVFMRLGASSEERSHVEIVTRFVGFEDTDRKIELREPRSVEPSYLISIWKEQGLDFFVVNSVQEAFFYRLLGGLALIETEVSKEEFPEHWKQLSSVMTGARGFKSKKDLDKNTFQKAPSPKKRMKVLKRDERKCRICGRSPANNSDIELHLHHIRPWSEGGVTDPENLLTLCHTCHNGLEPHFDASLFDYTNKESFSMTEYAKKIRDETNIYRTKMLEIFKEGFESSNS